MDRPITTIASGFCFLEAPRWHDERIWFSDFYTHRVLSARSDGGDLRVEADVPGQPSGLGWLPDGRLLVVSMHDARVLRREHDGTLVTHAELSHLVGGYPNDMVVDAHGACYVGHFGFDLDAGLPLQPADIVRVAPDGTTQVAASGLYFPNGSVITPDGRYLVAETFGNRISAFDIEGNGTLVRHRVWAQFADLPRTESFRMTMEDAVVTPDGMCLDAEGALWVADTSARRVIRVSEGGGIVDEVETRATAFACMLGGEDGGTLFICTSPDYFVEARKAARESTLVAVRVDVPHAGRP